MSITFEGYDNLFEGFNKCFEDATWQMCHYFSNIAKRNRTLSIKGYSVEKN